MTKGREESDGCTAPSGRRKTAVTEGKAMANLDGHEAGNGGHGQGEPKARQRGGKAATASQGARQLGLFSQTADSPQGDDDGAETGQPVAATLAVPKWGNRKGHVLPTVTMTLDEVANIGTLMSAFERVKENRGAPGPDRQSISDVDAHLDEILPRLSRELLEESYRPGDIRRVWIPKAGGGRRGLGIPDVIDRIVGQAAHQVMFPQYEPIFHSSSHGFRPERSCHTAITEAQKNLEDGYEWVVDLDLEKFFDKVNHERLLARLEKRITDRRLIRLIRRMLKAKVVMPDGVVVATEEGTPQGGPLSPLMSNIVLDELDWEMARRGYRFVRYADDVNIYVRSERAGKRVMESITRFIERRLRLKVNQEKSAVAKPEERHFLGFRLRREPMEGGTEVLLSKRSKDRIDEAIKAKTPRNWGQSFKACIDGLNRYLIGWINFFWICTAAEGRRFQKLDAHIRRRLRAILLKQWKRRRSIVRRLIRLGVNAKIAWRRIYDGRKALWALSHDPAVDRGLRNAHFAERGLESITERWRQRHETVAAPPRQLTLALG